ncbi:MAG: J domain-containing protein [Acidimicrobiales bacterium]
MDLERAHATLGVNATTPLSEVRTAYTTRAQMLHPDRYHGNDSLRVEAERAMKELNLAWETVRRAGENRHAAPGTTEPVAGSPRLPYQGECDLCGCHPAHPVTLRGVTGMVLFWRWQAFRAELCRSCGVGMFREVQAASLVKGWWGLIAPLANIVALSGNLLEYWRIKASPAPAARDPQVVTPLPGPVTPGRPVLGRAGPWAAVSVVAVVAVGLISSLAPSQGDSARTPPAPATDSAVGTCLDREGFTVSCADVDATWRITSMGPGCASTQATFEDVATGRTYCAIPQ